MQRITEIDMGLGDAARQQHPRARPVEVADQLHRATRVRAASIRAASIRPRRVPLMTRHKRQCPPVARRGSGFDGDPRLDHDDTAATG
jgi:hypothetical protein